MKKYINSWIGLSMLAGVAFLTSCEGDEDNEEPITEEPVVEDTTPSYTVPTTYVFEDASGNSTVSYSGQTARMDMLSEMVVEMKKGNTSGVSVSATVLKNMFANTNSPFSVEDLNTTTKQLYNKTVLPETFNAFIDSLATASTSTVSASNGVAGVVTSGEKSYLVSSQGVEYTQIIEKGLFAACFFNQISNNYLTAEKIGASVSNTPEEGNAYSPKEHHFDEAFGYFGAPIDFPTTSGKNIAKYSNTIDPILGTNKTIMDAFLLGRAAIVNDDQEALDGVINTLNTNIELVFAGAAIHYLNGTLENINDPALRSHELSEAVAFLGGLSVSLTPKSTVAEVNAWKDLIGYNFWDVVPGNITNVKKQIAIKYGISDADRDAL